MAKTHVERFLDKHNLPSKLSNVLRAVDHDEGFYVRMEFLGNKHSLEYNAENEKDLVEWLRLTAKLFQ